MRYLAAYVKKSTFNEGRLLDYDQSGRIVLSYRDSADGKLRSEALDPLELIWRWLLDSFSRSVGATPLHCVRSVSLASRRLGSTRLRRPTPVASEPMSPTQKPKKRPRQGQGNR